MRISDWSSDVCSSDLGDARIGDQRRVAQREFIFEGEGATLAFARLALRGRLRIGAVGVDPAQLFSLRPAGGDSHILAGVEVAILCLRAVVFVARGRREAPCP